MLFEPRISCFIAPLLLFLSSALGFTVPKAEIETSTSLLHKRTPPNTPVCPPGGRNYGRPDPQSCHNAWSLVTTHPVDTFRIQRQTGGNLGFATVIDETLYEFGPRGAIRSHPEHGTAPTPRVYNAGASKRQNGEAL